MGEGEWGGFGCCWFSRGWASGAAAVVVAAPLALLALLAAACSPPATSLPSASAPKSADAVVSAAPAGLVAAIPSVELGRVPFDRMVEARYELTNVSAQTIKLTAPPEVTMLEGC